MAGEGVCSWIPRSFSSSCLYATPKNPLRNRKSCWGTAKENTQSQEVGRNVQAIFGSYLKALEKFAT